MLAVDAYTERGRVAYLDGWCAASQPPVAPSARGPKTADVLAEPAPARGARAGPPATAPPRVWRRRGRGANES
jgi:hypothetical protein